MVYVFGGQRLELTNDGIASPTGDLGFRPGGMRNQLVLDERGGVRVGKLKVRRRSSRTGPRHSASAADMWRLAFSNRPAAAACTPAVFSTTNLARSQPIS